MKLRRLKASDGVGDALLLTGHIKLSYEHMGGRER